MPVKEWWRQKSCASEGVVGGGKTGCRYCSGCTCPLLIIHWSSMPYY